MTWSVVYTAPQAEPIAVREIEAQGIGTFCPQYRVGTWRGDKLKVKARSLLTRYVLVNLPDGAAWGPVANADGVQRLLLSGDGSPAKVSSEDVARLMVAHASGQYDYAAPRRDAAGRFRKHRKRRRRPRHGKVASGPPVV